MVWLVFAACFATRSNGFEGPDPIQAAEISTVLDFYQIEDVDERLRFYHHVRALDSRWREINNANNARSHRRQRSGQRR